MRRLLISATVAPTFVLWGLFPPSAIAQPTTTPLRVEYVTVSDTPLTFDLTLTGTIEARDSVSLGFRTGGRVIEMLVSEGDVVKAGQPLGSVDAVQQNQSLQVAQAALDSANASREQAVQAADRAAALLRRGIGTRAASDAANEALSSAEGAVSQATSQVEQATRTAEDTVLRAPSDAVVTARMVDPGQIVGAAQPALALAALDGLNAVFQTPDLPHLNDALDDQVDLQPLDYPTRHMSGTVSEIAPFVDPQTGSVAVRVRIDQQAVDAGLLGGAVRGTIRLPAGTGIAIPWTAVTAVGRDTAVWLVDADNRVKLQPVQVARFQDGQVVLNGGLKQGQVIVGEGSHLLYPDRLVEKAEVTR
ncbi:MAG: efflux RND transporter periplasmic adaptor subunit [Paracoccus denitrificans]|nr:MAG: efflux RND transporter periplasmic adaptor subunit [Paracoccus denitrificans]PZO85474.1 MAG: efflux RND transporter periplasmic adaptor subunit [Paracoccus denitrificans]